MKNKSLVLKLIFLGFLAGSLSGSVSARKDGVTKASVRIGSNSFGGVTLKEGIGKNEDKTKLSKSFNNSVKTGLNTNKVESSKSSVNSESKTESNKSSVDSKDKTGSNKSSINSKNKIESNKSSINSKDKTESNKSSVINSESKTESNKSSVDSKDKIESSKSSVNSESKTELNKSSVNSESKTELNKSSVNSESKTESSKSSINSKDKTESNKSSVDSENVSSNNDNQIEVIAKLGDDLFDKTDGKLPKLLKGMTDSFKELKLSNFQEGESSLNAAVSFIKFFERSSNKDAVKDLKKRSKDESVSLVKNIRSLNIELKKMNNSLKEQIEIFSKTTISDEEIIEFSAFECVYNLLGEKLKDMLYKFDDKNRNMGDNFEIILKNNKYINQLKLRCKQLDAVMDAFNENGTNPNRPKVYRAFENLMEQIKIFNAKKKDIQSLYKKFADRIKILDQNGKIPQNKLKNTKIKAVSKNSAVNIQKDKTYDSCTKLSKLSDNIFDENLPNLLKNMSDSFESLNLNKLNIGSKKFSIDKEMKSFAKNFNSKDKKNGTENLRMMATKEYRSLIESINELSSKIEKINKFVDSQVKLFSKAFTNEKILRFKTFRDMCDVLLNEQVKTALYGDKDVKVDSKDALYNGKINELQANCGKLDLILTSFFKDTYRKREQVSSAFEGLTSQLEKFVEKKSSLDKKLADKVKEVADSEDKSISQKDEEVADSENKSASQKDEKIADSENKSASQKDETKISDSVGNSKKGFRVVKKKKIILNRKKTQGTVLRDFKANEKQVELSEKEEVTTKGNKKDNIDVGRKHKINNRSWEESSYLEYDEKQVEGGFDKNSVVSRINVALSQVENIKQFVDMDIDIQNSVYDLKEIKTFLNNNEKISDKDKLGCVKSLEEVEKWVQKKQAELSNKANKANEVNETEKFNDLVTKLKNCSITLDSALSKTPVLNAENAEKFVEYLTKMKDSVVKLGNMTDSKGTVKPECKKELVEEKKFLNSLKQIKLDGLNFSYKIAGLNIMARQKPLSADAVKLNISKLGTAISYVSEFIK